MLTGKIAIIGAGVAGLMTGLQLEQRGMKNYQIFEMKPQLSEFGAGITIAPNAQRAMGRDLWSKISGITQKHEDGLFFKFYDGRTTDHIVDVKMKPGETYTATNRVALVEKEYSLLPPGKVTFNRKIVRIEKNPAGSSRYKIIFDKGDPYYADVIIGADGARSQVREILKKNTNSQNKGIETFTGTWAYRFTIPRYLFEEAVKGQGLNPRLSSTPTIFIGRDAHFVMFPIKDPKGKQELVNVVAFNYRDGQATPNLRDPFADVRKSTFLREFEQFHPGIQKFLQLNNDPKKWAIFETSPTLDKYAHNGIVLVGDAAGSGRPHMGAFAGLAMEEAAFVARVLAHPKTNNQNVDRALELVNTLRKPRGDQVIEGSLKAGRLYQLHQIKDEQAAGELKAKLPRLYDWFWDYSPDHETKAIEDHMKQV